ncbi:hypothetical protein KGY73_09855 [bacterium]|nr:hypothetical protein [bacterium]
MTFSFSSTIVPKPERTKLRKKKNPILSRLSRDPSPESIDYVHGKKSFQLHNLLTEKRHPRTWDLSFTVKKNVKEGLDQLLTVDEDVSRKFHQMAKDTGLLEQAARSVCRALREERKVFIYGCGSTGRLAKQMESALWRPFWRKVQSLPVWKKLNSVLPRDIEDRLIGEMTGGDRALISALEGLEDLSLVGELQVEDRRVERGDVVFGITEGGETSSVIGAMRKASAQYGQLTPEAIGEARSHLYFLYNNPDELLKPFPRTQEVVENPAVTKINLTTGPQAVAGSTRMQAATSETYVMGLILEKGIEKALQGILSRQELVKLGFNPQESMEEKLLSFEKLREILKSRLNELASFTQMETQTYQKKKRTTYFAKKALISVFIDCAERSPTFHLYPLDSTRQKERRCWFQVWTEGKDSSQAWRQFLGREFRGLEESFYKPRFLKEIQDPYLKNAALQSLAQAGNDQQHLYDFSFSRENLARGGPQPGDLGVMVCMDEEIQELLNPQSSSRKWMNLFKERKSRLTLVSLSSKEPSEVKKILGALPLVPGRDSWVFVPVPEGNDPLGLKRQILLKILLNTHSTGVMSRMGRVVGNTMTNVSPSNLKLIGRATYLIMSHVNDVLSQKEWREKYGNTELLTYAQANAVLFQAMERTGKGEISEVELSIIRILESLRNKRCVDWEETFSVARTEGLERYLGRHNPALKSS